MLLWSHGGAPPLCGPTSPPHARGAGFAEPDAAQPLFTCSWKSLKRAVVSSSRLPLVSRSVVVSMYLCSVAPAMGRSISPQALKKS